MRYNLFTGNMKLADLILTNYRLLYVLPYFDIELGFGEKTVKQVCEQNNISTALMLLVCNIYTFEDYEPNEKALENISLEDIMKYLQKSHKDYLEIRMPEIINKILDLVSGCHIKHGDMLALFCKKYKEEVTVHFKYEEETVFPYIHSLLKGINPNDYRIEDYRSTHSNIELSLHDLKNIIIKYLPEECTLEKCQSILFDIFMFEYDLNKHTILEDKILVGLVKNMERKI